MMKRLTLMVLVALVGGSLLSACQKVEGPLPEDEVVVQEETMEPEVANEPETTATMEQADVALAEVVIEEAPFTVEIAETDEEKARGLMNRESMPENHGMWFVFDGMVQEQFWMKDTLIPLDLIFVDDQMKVVHIKENAEPLSTNRIGSPKLYQYVLELNAGSAQKYGIGEGSIVELKMGKKKDEK